jgi:hypothetical protein
MRTTEWHAGEVEAVAWRGLLVIAGGVVALLWVVADRYGFHRDELYFIEAGQHLAFGYVDQPPLTPALARVQTASFGTEPRAVRVVPALASGVIALLAGLLARELGGGRQAQTWSAAVIGGSGFVLAVGHLLSTATFDFAFWLGLIVIAARLLRTNDPRWWLAYGAVAGLALWNKHLPILLTAALLTALAGARRWDLLAPRWLAAGGAVALVIAAPTVFWQATHGWPQLEMARALSERIGGQNRATLLPLQLVMLGPLVVPLAVAGVRWLRGGGGLFAPLMWAYATALALTFVTGGRPYYPLPLAATLMIAGAVAWSRRDPPRAVGRLLAAHVAVSASVALPLLPAEVVVDTPLPKLNDTLVETIGWEELAQQMRAVVEELPEGDRGNVVLLTGSYGEAGALDLYGPRLGLPPVFSGHNSYADWRRPDDDGATVVAVRLQPSSLAPYFRSCRQVAEVAFELDVENEVHGAPIVVCHDLQGTWSRVWPRLRHLS